jgi:MoxR-like ATPase
MTETRATTEDEVRELRRNFRALREAVSETFLGHEDVVHLLLYAVLADGHVLLEGAPGLGKTTLVKSLAAALDLDFRRVQFTPDLVPADVLGTRVLEIDAAGARHFTFQRGPIFTNVLLADEINRATPRTQSALLEAMQERQVTLFGETRALDDPFVVIATQNPIEMEGTYPLPEAQLDRFLLKIELAAPELGELIAILAASGERRPPTGVALERNTVARMRHLVRGVPASSDVVELVARLVLATHPGAASAPEDVRRFVRYGASPRGGQAVLAAARARALVEGRAHVAREDVEAVAPAALRHRLLLGYEGEAAGIHADALVAAALAAARRG